MRSNRPRAAHVQIVLGMLSVAVAVPGCAIFFPLPGSDGDTEAPANLSYVEGIDPRQPNIERTTRTIDFAGVRTIRVELHTARLVIEQIDDAGGDEATIKVIEIITAGGLGKESLEDKLLGTDVRAARSFVDSGRLDVTAILADGLQPHDVAFDVRLTLPRAAGAEVFLNNGPVEIIGLKANVEIVTTDGGILVSDVPGNVVARTTNNPIDIRGAGGNVEANTTQADVSVRATPAAGSRLLVRTAGGDVYIEVPRTFAASLNLAAGGGTVAANLDGFAVSNIVTGAGTLSAMLNGGGGQIDGAADSGNVEFTGSN